MKQSIAYYDISWFWESPLLSGKPGFEELISKYLKIENEEYWNEEENIG